MRWFHWAGLAVAGAFCVLVGVDVAPGLVAPGGESGGGRGPGTEVGEVARGAGGVELVARAGKLEDGRLGLPNSIAELERRVSGLEGRAVPADLSGDLTGLGRRVDLLEQGAGLLERDLRAVAARPGAEPAGERPDGQVPEPAPVVALGRAVRRQAPVQLPVGVVRRTGVPDPPVAINERQRAWVHNLPNYGLLRTRMSDLEILQRLGSANAWELSAEQRACPPGALNCPAPPAGGR